MARVRWMVPWADSDEKPAIYHTIVNYERQKLSKFACARVFWAGSGRGMARARWIVPWAQNYERQK
jgi:hypothetical protein